MHPDQDSSLKVAFTELQRRRREDAPPYEAMRAQVLARAERNEFRAARRFRLPALATATAFLLVAIAARHFGTGPQRSSTESASHPSAEQLEQLITTIELHLEEDAPAAAPEYSTDLLLVANPTASNP